MPAKRGRSEARDAQENNKKKAKYEKPEQEYDDHESDDPPKSLDLGSKSKDNLRNIMWTLPHREGMTRSNLLANVQQAYQGMVGIIFIKLKKCCLTS